MPKNVADKNKSFKSDYSNNNSGLGHGYYEEGSLRNKKKNPHKSTEHFEKEKKVVSYMNLNIILYLVPLINKLDSQLIEIQWELLNYLEHYLHNSHIHYHY